MQLGNSDMSFQQNVAKTSSACKQQASLTGKPALDLG
jgi:hypothetical protein